MSRMLPTVVSAELIKLRGLPAVTATVLGTVAGATVVAVASAAASTGTAAPAEIALQAVPFLQVGTITVGIVAVGTEYAGGQIRTSLLCVPDRMTLLAGKALAALVWAAGTALAALAAALGTAWTTLAVRGVTPDTGTMSPWPLAGAAVYLVLIGLLSHGLTLGLRASVPALVGMLSLVLVISPLLNGRTVAARYLPDRAGALLYVPETGGVLTPVTGLVVLLGWTATVSAVATAAFLRRDV